MFTRVWQTAARALSLANSSWKHGGWRHYRVRQRRYRLRGGRQRLRPASETVIINAVNNYKLRKMPEGSSWKTPFGHDPAQFAMSGVRDANVRVGDFVVVGLGAIGQIFVIQPAKRAGASVVIGRRSYRPSL